MIKKQIATTLREIKEIREHVNWALLQGIPNDVKCLFPEVKTIEYEWLTDLPHRLNLSKINEVEIPSELDPDGCFYEVTDEFRSVLVELNLRESRLHEIVNYFANSFVLDIVSEAHASKLCKNNEGTLLLSF